MTDNPRISQALGFLLVARGALTKAAVLLDLTEGTQVVQVAHITVVAASDALKNWPAKKKEAV